MTVKDRSDFHVLDSIYSTELMQCENGTIIIYFFNLYTVKSLKRRGDNGNWDMIHTYTGGYKNKIWKRYVSGDARAAISNLHSTTSAFSLPKRRNQLAFPSTQFSTSAATASDIIALSQPLCRFLFLSNIYIYKPIKSHYPILSCMNFVYWNIWLGGNVLHCSSFQLSVSLISE